MKAKIVHHISGKFIASVEVQQIPKYPDRLSVSGGTSYIVEHVGHLFDVDGDGKPTHELEILVKERVSITGIY